MYQHSEICHPTVIHLSQFQYVCLYNKAIILCLLYSQASLGTCVARREHGLDMLNYCGDLF